MVFVGFFVDVLEVGEGLDEVGVRLEVHDYGF